MCGGCELLYHHAPSRAHNAPFGHSGFGHSGFSLAFLLFGFAASRALKAVFAVLMTLAAIYSPNTWSSRGI
jgi:hypothetical protein